MGKTLDGLLAHVTDRIALTGQYGTFFGDLILAVFQIVQMFEIMMYAPI